MRLKGEKKIEFLFKEGKSAFVYPMKAVFLFSTNGENIFSFGVSVSKRNFKKAVDRNRIKRQLREIIRLSSHNFSDLYPKLSVMYIYVAKEHLDFKIIEDATQKLNKKISIQK